MIHVFLCLAYMCTCIIIFGLHLYMYYYVNLAYMCTCIIRFGLHVYMYYYVWLTCVHVLLGLAYMCTCNKTMIVILITLLVLYMYAHETREHVVH